ncbi:Coq4 family protein [Mesonia aquimarina]|uniref:Coq4 family protein n=1 Tax=Mesonia aquimarina TaxID=1504967 RepID=UPI000EF6015F|nr:Coq4 family protein [Mesonia aquimarina]
MRKKLVLWLFEFSKKIYTKWFKKNHIPWCVSVQELLLYPSESFGHKLGEFLNQHHFQLIPKVERHDAYHTLTQYGVSVEEEIALQYLCLGNGKKSPYMFGAIILGTFILPEYFAFYYKSFLKGKDAKPFHHFDYKKLLQKNYNEFRAEIFQKNKSTSI